MAKNSNAPLNDPFCPTPRTDAAWNASFELRAWGAGGTARAMRDKCAKMEREIIALRTELENIANAKPSEWGEMKDDFQAWAQSRARHTLALNIAGLPRAGNAATPTPSTQSNP